jgi:hypothetical protein
VDILPEPKATLRLNGELTVKAVAEAMERRATAAEIFMVTRQPNEEKMKEWTGCGRCLRGGRGKRQRATFWKLLGALALKFWLPDDLGRATQGLPGLCGVTSSSFVTAHNPSSAMEIR